MISNQAMRVLLVAIGVLIVIEVIAQLAIHTGVLPAGWMPGGN